MQPKSFGVAKWSTLRSVTSSRVGQRLGERLAGTGEVLVADDDEHGEVRPRPAARG